MEFRLDVNVDLGIWLDFRFVLDLPVSQVLEASQCANKRKLRKPEEPEPARMKHYLREQTASFGSVVG